MAKPRNILRNIDNRTIVCINSLAKSALSLLKILRKPGVFERVYKVLRDKDFRIAESVGIPTISLKIVMLGRCATYQFLVFLVVLFFTACNPSDNKNPVSTTLLETELIFPIQDEHTHGSTIAELPNGDLLAGWFQGSGERWADDVVIMGARKKKGADNWSAPFILADQKGFPDCNPVLFLDNQNRLWLMWMTIIANQWETALLKYRISQDYTEMEGSPVWKWQENLMLKPGGSAERGIQPGDPFVNSVKEQLRDYTAYIESNPGENIYMDMWKAHANRILSLARGEDMVRAGRVLDLDGQVDAEQLGYPYFRRMGWQTANKPFITKGGRLIVPLYSGVT